jgi:hypothetical protein
MQIDNQWWPPEQAPRRAAGYRQRMVQLDYYGINRTPDNAMQGKLRQAPASARQSQGQLASREPKVAAFAHRWARLVLNRHNDYVLKFV